jgi:probable F420-dependent oxidoreductase
MTDVHVGVMFANGGRGSEPEHATRLAVEAEALGYESLWAVQHVVMPFRHASQYPYASEGTVPGGAAVAIPDPLVWLGYVAAATSRIRLATGVLVLPQQHALVIAKQVATLDRLSGGRCLLGVGAGWLREEFEALGADFGGRGALLDEQIQVMRAAWADGVVSHSGPRMHFEELAVEPKPVRSDIPIVIGGHTDAAVRRAARLGDGFFPLGRRSAELAILMRSLAAALQDAGRPARSVEVTTDAPRNVEQARTLKELGVARVVVNAPNVAVAEIRSTLESRLVAVHDLMASA